MAVAMEIRWPVKQREMVQWVADSRPWNDLDQRPDDIVIATWSKTGTTLLQQLVVQMVFGGDPEIYGPGLSPWIDSRFTPDAVEVAKAQTHRRVLKTHLPIDALVYSPQAKYIYSGRDIRDTFWSWHHHHSSFTPEALAFINALPGWEGQVIGYPDPDIRVAFREWLERDGYPNWPFWGHVQGWFDARNLPNLMLVHFSALIADTAGEARRIADFLEIDVPETAWPRILEYSGIDHTRKLAAQNERLEKVFKGGGATFINRGTNGRWRDVLTLEDNAAVDAAAAEHLSADCARWLATGQLPR